MIATVGSALDIPADAFRGKVALITGAARGFGLSFSRALLDRGASVALLDLDGEELERACASLGQPDRTLALTCDVADEAAMTAAVAKVAGRFGGVDILINNAGLHSAKYNTSFEKLGSAEFRRLFDVNVFAVVTCSLACKPFMAARGGGAIINIASTASYTLSSAYGVSKLAVRGLTVNLARDLSDARIRVNAISPGLIGTETIRKDIPEIFDRYVNDLQAIHRAGEESDIVAAMLFLCSDMASFVTGETLRIAGGYPINM